MLDINDFIVARGGNPDKIKESQRRRGKPVEIVDQVIELFEEQRKGTMPLLTTQLTSTNIIQLDMLSPNMAAQLTPIKKLLERSRRPRETQPNCYRKRRISRKRRQI